MKQAKGQMSLFDLDTLCGKTSPGHSLPTKAKTSASSSKSSAKLKIPTPIFLDLRRGGVNGILAEPSWVTGIPSHGGCSMQDFGESPSVVEESGLWQILEESVPQKYYLSAKACAGVLRRAERRGKELPTILKTALEQQIERWEKYGNPMPKFCDMSEKNAHVISWCFDGGQITSPLHKERNEQNICHTLGRTGCGRVYCVYDARGNGDGKTVPTITGDHNNRLTDYTAVVCETLGFNPLNGSKARGNGETINGAPTLRSQRPTACVIAIDRAAFNQGVNAQYDIGIDDKGIAQTVMAKGPGAVCYAVGNGQTAQLSLSETARTLNCMHDQQAVMYPVYCLKGNGIDRADTAGCNGKGVKEDESYTFNTVDRHAVCCPERHTHHFLMRMREGKEGGGKGALVQKDKSGTIACNNDQTLFQETESCYIVRRLTPLECCRLQGMPDDWLDGVNGSDAAKYKLFGNGMALPNALYIMEGLSEDKSNG